MAAANESTKRSGAVEHRAAEAESCFLSPKVTNSPGSPLRVKGKNDPLAGGVGWGAFDPVDRPVGTDRGGAYA